MEKNDLPESWAYVSLSTIAKINPKKPSKDEYSDNTLVSFVPMKSVEALTGKINLNKIRKCGEVRKGYTYFENNDILFAKITPCMENGKIAIADELENGMGFGSTEFHVIRLKDKINPKFYFHYLIQDVFRNKAQHKMKGTAGQLRVSSDYLKDGLIPLPPLNEQKRIVEKIEELFSIIDDLMIVFQENIHKLSLFKTSFLISMFSQSFETLPLIDVSEKITDGEHLKPIFIDSGVPFLSAKDLLASGISFSNTKFISEFDAKKFRTKCDPKLGDVLIVSRGNVGRTCIVDVDTPFCLLGSVILLRPNEKLSTKFLTYFLKSTSTLRKLVKISSSTVQGAIYLRDLKHLQIPIPSMDKQNQISDEIDYVFSILNKHEIIFTNLIQFLPKIKNTILKQAFEGKLVPQDPSDEPASELLKRIKNQ